MEGAGCGPFEKESPVKVGLVLTGGGAAGIRHVALLQALDEASIKPSHIVGTSTGALCASGYSWAGLEALKAVWFGIKKESDIFRSRFWVEFPFSLGAKSSAPLRKKVEALFSQRKPGGVPFTVTCTDLVSQSLCYFDGNDPEIVDKVVGSASIPILVDPVPGAKGPLGYERLYVDGGCLENAPVQAALDTRPDVVLVSHCFPRTNVKPDRYFKVDGMKGMALRTIETMTRESYREDLEVCQIGTPIPIYGFEPPWETISAMDFDYDKIVRAFDETLARVRKEISLLKASGSITLPYTTGRNAT